MNLVSEPVNTTVLSETGELLRGCSGWLHLDLAQEFAERLHIAGFGEELDHRIRDDLADAADIVEVLIGLGGVLLVLRPLGGGQHRFAKILDRAMPRQQLCIALADMADAEREDQLVQSMLR